jgi:hypothetical protein
MTLGAVEATFVLFATSNLVGLLVSHVRQGVRIDALKDDLHTVKKALGISNGDSPAFIRRSECELRESGVKEAVVEIKDRLDRIEERIAAVR